jgi:hypothetical protein
MLRAVWLVFLNEFRLLARDRVGVLMLVLAPAVIILVAGLSLGNIYGVGPAPGAYVVPIIDEDHGAAARAIVSALGREPALTLLKVDHLASARLAVERRDRTPLAILIPAGTTRALETGGEAQLVFYVDPVKRLEVNAIELHLDALCRQITAQAQDQARRRLAQQGTAIQRQFEQLTQQIKQAQAAAKRYRRQFSERRETAETSLNAQVQRAIGGLEKQTQAAIERSTAQAKLALAREMAPRREALLTVSRYLTALQTSERDFDKWFATLKAMAGSHSTEIPPPPPSRFLRRRNTASCCERSVSSAAVIICGGNQTRSGSVCRVVPAGTRGLRRPSRCAGCSTRLASGSSRSWRTLPAAGRRNAQRTSLTGRSQTLATRVRGYPE